MWLLVAVFACLLRAGAQAQHPCSVLLEATAEEPAGHWTALLKVPVPHMPHAAATFRGWHLRLTFSNPVEELLHNASGLVTTTTVDDRNFVIRQREDEVVSSLVLLLSARHSGSAGSLSLTTVKYNNVLICNDSIPAAPSTTPAPVDKPPCREYLHQVTAHTRHGEWTASLTVPVPRLPHAASHGWHLRLTFNKPIDLLSHNVKGAMMTTVDDRNFIMRSPQGAPQQSSLALKLHVQYQGTGLTLDSIKYNNVLVCNGSSQYNYLEALRLTLLFLEAQQSGPLAADHRVPWRGDSCTTDRGDHGEDLTGGYYTGSVGRTVKFTFPNAAANAVLAWGVIAHSSAYQEAGELVNAIAAVEWGANYLSRCYTTSGEVYAIVGDQIRETTLFWNRPEDLQYDRPTIALSPYNPGSDLFGEVVAALASASVVLKDHWEGPQRSQRYLAQARKLFEMAAANRGDYMRAMQLLTPTLLYTPGNGDECELLWSAAWMYRATSEQHYLRIAEIFYKKLRLHFRQRPFTFFYWDDKALGAQILLYQATYNATYAEDARVFCDEVAFNTSRHTPRGLLRGLGEFASGLQLGAWASFACMQLGESMRQYGLTSNNPYLDFAVRQVHYALGDTGRSFLIGFGQNYPTKPNDMASLCAPSPAECDRSLWESDVVNEHELRGALVFGPDNEDRYEDSRRGVCNNVDVIGNAGLSSALATLADLRAQGRLDLEDHNLRTRNLLLGPKRTGLPKTRTSIKD